MEFPDLETPAALIDLDRVDRNLSRVAAYVNEHDLRLRPHTKTHKSARLAAAQVDSGAAGLTVATPREAEVMAEVADDILVAYPPVGPHRLRRLLALPPRVQLTIALDSEAALSALNAAASSENRDVGVLIEVDLGMRRCGVADVADTVRLARTAADGAGTEFRGVMFYPGHVRDPVGRQTTALERVSSELAGHLEALADAGLPAEVVSGGSTPTLFRSHEIAGITEIRPGTYIFNDCTTAAIGACDWEDCAYSVLATVVSTAVDGQAVVDAGSKALSKEELRSGRDGEEARGSAATLAGGFGALLNRPEVPVRAVSEEHGLLDLAATEWRPAVGDRVRVVPNHVCVSVNLQETLRGIRDGAVVDDFPVAARGRSADLSAADLSAAAAEAN